MKFNSTLGVMMSMSLILLSILLMLSNLIIMGKEDTIIEFEIQEISGVKMSLFILFDFVSSYFFSTVLLISGSVMLFSSSYMMADKLSNRFIMVVLLFIMSMGLLIFSPSMLSILLGWDGLGVTSYLLVCYYCSEKSYNASMLTALTNRLGDVAILITISLNSGVGVFNFTNINASNSSIIFGAAALVVAGMTKSAQIPFSAWLPAAMAAPTPVSALVHSSTLVTAGVYLLLRMNFLIQLEVLGVAVLFMGVITMLMAGMSAMFEGDMKKIIALSTLSQLGLMFFGLGLGETVLVFIHLISHAYFKAMMFMSAGAMIHSVKDYQDMRKLGSWSNLSPTLKMGFLLGSLSLTGIPFTSGFYSKDTLLEQFLMESSNTMIWVFSLLATFLTMGYSIRVMYTLFMSYSLREPLSQETDPLYRMGGGVYILIPFSVMGGFPLLSLIDCPPTVILPMWMKMLILVIIMVVLMGYIFASKIHMKKTLIMSSLHLMWFLPFTCSRSTTHLLLTTSKLQLKGQELSWSFWAAGYWMKSFESGSYLNSITLPPLMLSVMVLLITLIIL